MIDMNIQKCIKLGDKIKIAGETGEYATIVERIENESDFYVSTPWFAQRKAELKKDKVYTFSTVCEKGVLSFRTRVIDYDENDTIPLIKMRIISEPERLQRRRSFRVNIMLDVKIIEVAPTGRQEDAAVYMTKTLNISETGMQFLSDKKYLPKDVLMCQILLDKFEVKACIDDITARVVRCEYPQQEGDQFRVGVVFEQYSARSKALLGKFIIRSQLRKR